MARKTIPKIPLKPLSNDNKREKLRKAIDDANRKYGRMLQRLAD